MATNILLMLWLDRLQRRALAEQRTFRNRYSAFDLNDTLFIANFRLSKQATSDLIDKLRPHLSENRRLSATDKVLATLRFLASGRYQRSVANDVFLAISQKSVSRAIHETINAVNDNLLDEFISFPTSPEELLVLKRAFMEKYAFPDIIGVIDCIHVAIVPPSDNPPFAYQSQYVNSEGYHSINVQLVCDHNLKILNVNARFPGSVDDTFIFRASALHRHLRNAFSNNPTYGWLLGDSDYPLEPWLLVPFQDASPGTAEEKFNDIHRKVWINIERCSGVLKNRFRCLLKRRVLRYSPAVAGKIINTCVALHNWCLQYNLENPTQDTIEDDDMTENYHHQSLDTISLYNTARSMRMQVANSL